VGDPLYKSGQQGELLNIRRLSARVGGIIDAFLHL
jgi:hypothetical protein